MKTYIPPTSSIIDPKMVSDVLTTTTTTLEYSQAATRKQPRRQAVNRMNKRKPRKCVDSNAMDALNCLHAHTVMSTKPFATGQIYPAPPGCVDYQFTTLSTYAADLVPIHTELAPPTSNDSSYGLELLLNIYRQQYVNMVKLMKSDDYKKDIEDKIAKEKEQQAKLLMELEQLQKEVDILSGADVDSLGKQTVEDAEVCDFQESVELNREIEITRRSDELRPEVQLSNCDNLELEQKQESILAEFQQESTVTHEVSGQCTSNESIKQLFPQVLLEDCSKKSTVETNPSPMSNKIEESTTPANDNIEIFDARDTHRHHNEHSHRHRRHKSSKRSKKHKKHRHRSRSRSSSSRRKELLTKCVHNRENNLPMYDCEISNTSCSFKMKFRTSPSSATPKQTANEESVVGTKNNLSPGDGAITGSNVLIEDIKFTAHTSPSDSSEYRKVPPLKLALKRNLSSETINDITASEIITTDTDNLVNSETKDNTITLIDMIVTDIEVPKKKSKHHRHSSTKTSEYSSSPDISPDSMLYNNSIASNSPIAVIKMEEMNSRQEFHKNVAMGFSSPANEHQFINNNNNNNNYKVESQSSCDTCQVLPPPKIEESDNKWEELSLKFDRMVEFVSMKLECDFNNSPPPSMKPDNRNVSPNFMQPPPLHRADSPSAMGDCTSKKKTSVCSSKPLRLGLLYSPAPLDGPYSPVSPSNSPPELYPTINGSSTLENTKFINEKYYYNEKFRPKGKGWKWR